MELKWLLYLNPFLKSKVISTSNLLISAEMMSNKSLSPSIVSPLVRQNIPKIINLGLQDSPIYKTYTSDKRRRTMCINILRFTTYYAVLLYFMPLDS